MKESTGHIAIAGFLLALAAYCVGCVKDKPQYEPTAFAVQTQQESESRWPVKIPAHLHGKPIDICVYPEALSDGGFVINVHTEEDKLKPDGVCWGTVIYPGKEVEQKPRIADTKPSLGYVDEGNVPVYGLDTKKMGADFPKITLYGHHLEYREDDGLPWYYFAHTDFKVYWLPVTLPAKEGEDAELRLMLPARYDPKKNRFQYYKQGTWVDDEVPGAERYREVILQTEERFKEKKEAEREARRRRSCPGGRCLV